MFRIYRRQTAAPASWICCFPLPQCMSTEASLTRKACQCTKELFRATHLQLRKCFWMPPFMGANRGAVCGAELKLKLENVMARGLQSHREQDADAEAREPTNCATGGRSRRNERNWRAVDHFCMQTVDLVLRFDILTKFGPMKFALDLPRQAWYTGFVALTKPHFFRRDGRRKSAAHTSTCPCTSGYYLARSVRPFLAPARS
jgi:hypothetical protein